LSSVGICDGDDRGDRRTDCRAGERVGVVGVRRDRATVSNSTGTEQARGDWRLDKSPSAPPVGGPTLREVEQALAVVLGLNP
jgi:hypothetical protein